jgi:carbon monoxide dehydrogenase subunit G
MSASYGKQSRRAEKKRSLTRGYMKEYEQSRLIQAAPDAVFEFVSDIGNLPDYLPTVRNASMVDGERIHMQGEANGHPYEDTGFFRIDKAKRRMEWGSDGDNNYGGWLEVKGGQSAAASEVTVHIKFDPKPELARRMEKQGGRDQAINDGIKNALTSIQNYCEGKGGKVESARQK